MVVVFHVIVRYLGTAHDTKLFIHDRYFKCRTVTEDIPVTVCMRLLFLTRRQVRKCGLGLGLGLLTLLKLKLEIASKIFSLTI